MATQRGGDVAARVAVRSTRLRIAAADPPLCRLHRRARRAERPEHARRRPAQRRRWAGWKAGAARCWWRWNRCRRPHQALPLPRPVVAELAGAGACGDRQHRSGLPAHQQVLQPQLFGARPLMWHDPQADRPHRHRHRAGAAHRRRRARTDRAHPWRTAADPGPGAGHPPGRRRFLQRLRAGDPRAQQPLLQHRGPGHQVRRQPAPCRHAAGHRAGVAAHGRSAAAHLRGHARAQAGGGGGRLWLRAASSARATPAAGAWPTSFRST
jgi:hypothetical protein